MSLSFRLVMDIPASTKRNPPATEGRVTGPVSYLTGLFIEPLTQLTPDVVTQMGLDALIKHYATATDGANDVRDGDILTVAGRDYPVMNVTTWPWREFGATSQSKKRITVQEFQQGN